MIKLWGTLWINVWGLLQVLGIYPSLDRKWFAWVVEQAGFVYFE